VARSTDYLEKRFQAKFDRPNLFQPIYHHSGFSAPLHPVIANESLQSIQSFQWGLVPFWTKDEVAAERIRTQTLNAKAETIHQKPSFRVSIMTKRCLVLVDGFYEWREEGKKKYPYYISLVSNDAFALAGIWDRWLNNCTGEMKDTFSIITTRANPLLKDLQPPIIQRYYGDACQRVSARTVHHHHRVLSESLKFVVGQGYLGRNPCDMVDAPSAKKKAMRTMTPCEVGHLPDIAMSSPYYPVIYTAISTGLSCPV
jgi:putative SOS response-associated peptidase YedK